MTPSENNLAENNLAEDSLVLGIETSCDETAVAVVAADRRILSNVVLSQIEEHRPYGGVVPEIAARSHVEHLDRLIVAALEEANVGFGDLTAVAATGGPGLIGGVMVGLVTGKAIAASRQLPFVAVNHLEAHALTVRLTDNIPFPYLLLLVSGGHCQLLAVRGVGNYQRLGTTIDDAVGEAFDKTAKLLGLDYPGGPEVERRARDGDPKRFALPRPLRGRAGCDFSFSGLKTAVRRTVEDLLTKDPYVSKPNLTDLSTQDVADLAAGFQTAVGDVLCDRVEHAFAAYREQFDGPVPLANPTLVVAGGVAANRFLLDRLTETAERHGFRALAPPPGLCTDNGVMVAWAGIERLRVGLSDGLDVPPRARWALDPNAPPALGAGVKA